MKTAQICSVTMQFTDRKKTDGDFDPSSSFCQEKVHVQCYYVTRFSIVDFGGADRSVKRRGMCKEPHY